MAKRKAAKKATKTKEPRMQGEMVVVMGKEKKRIGNQPHDFVEVDVVVERYWKRPEEIAPEEVCPRCKWHGGKFGWLGEDGCCRSCGAEYEPE